MLIIFIPSLALPPHSLSYSSDTILRLELCKGSIKCIRQGFHQDQPQLWKFLRHESH